MFSNSTKEYAAATLRCLSRQCVRRNPARASKTCPPRFQTPQFSSATLLRNDKRDEHDKASTSFPQRASGDHEGEHARTSDEIQFEYPQDDLAGKPPVHGSGAAHNLRTLQSFSLQDKVAVITGAGGLGFAMTQGIVTSGADVAIVDINKEAATRQSMELLENFRKENPDSKRSPKITAHYADVANPDSVKQVFAEIVEEHGKVDSLVTTAGFTENFDAISYPHDRMQKLWGVNVDGTYLFAVETAKHLMARNAPGSIVCIGSMSGSIVNVPQPQAPYNASKAAVRHLVSSLAVEWSHANIRVNNISPGYMLTALTKKILDENPELRERWTSLIPVGKMGRPEDLMGPVVFLLSDASSYVTGADLRVDGAYTCT